jgi:hypothetical protein
MREPTLEEGQMSMDDWRTQEAGILRSFCNRALLKFQQILSSLRKSNSSPSPFMKEKKDLYRD